MGDSEEEIDRLHTKLLLTQFSIRIALYSAIRFPTLCCALLSCTALYCTAHDNNVAE